MGALFAPGAAGARFIPAAGKQAPVAEVVALMNLGTIRRDAVTPRFGIHINHRRVGLRDVFLVVGARAGEELTLRASGRSPCSQAPART